MSFQQTVERAHGGSVMMYPAQFTQQFPSINRSLRLAWLLSAAASQKLIKPPDKGQLFDYVGSTGSSKGELYLPVITHTFILTQQS